MRSRQLPILISMFADRSGLVGRMMRGDFASPSGPTCQATQARDFGGRFSIFNSSSSSVTSSNSRVNLHGLLAFHAVL